VKLAWYLGAYAWDVVHLVYPSLLGWFVLPLCAWRAIPTYCSHHVDMELYFKKYTQGIAYKLGTFFYWQLFKFPAQQWGTVNASMTQCFLDEHLPLAKSGGLRTAVIPTGVQTERFNAESKEQRCRERKKLVDKLTTTTATKNSTRRTTRSSSSSSISEDTKLLLMVQRLAPEKEIQRVFPALRQLKGKVNVHLVIVGHGPSEDELKELAKGLPVTFLGRIPNSDLPPLYRAADVFITCSRSETYGLTVLESLACSTPVVIPHCIVFDELWKGKLPDKWIFEAGKNNSLAEAIAAASNSNARKWLLQNPVKASWEVATDTLLKQYEDMILMNEPVKRRHVTLVNILAIVLRVVAIGLALFVSYHVMKNILQHIIITIRTITTNPSTDCEERAHFN